MALKPELLAILACPKDKGPLYYLTNEDKLYNPRLGWTYEVRDDIPIMLIDDATRLPTSEVARLDERISREAIPPTFADGSDAGDETEGDVFDADAGDVSDETEGDVSDEAEEQEHD